VYEPYYPYQDGGLISYSPIYVPNYYAYAPYSAYDAYSYQYLPDNYDYYGYEESDYDWKTSFLRTLIGFVLGNSENDYYGTGAYDSDYASSQDLYDYGSYQEDVSYYPSDENPLLDSIPVGDLTGPSYCGYSSSLLREILAQGYEQGYYAGQYAADNRRERRRFLDRVYSLDNEFYDPYSSTISENRRVFAAGYGMGYQDAVAGRDDYVSDYGNDSDLFSLLTSNVIGL
jgi:hypothetical protein